ncbi:hypothetical protein Lser_V15G19446 [Lactuca serriola]
MGFSPKPTPRKDFRSITLPCRSHPCTYRIDKVLNKVKTWESTSSLSNPFAEIICSGVFQLTELYECLDDLVKTCPSKTSLDSSNQNMRWTDELLDVSVILLDIFSNISDLMLQTKQHVRDLGCDLRRNGGPSIDSIIDNNTAFRKKLRKDIRTSVASLNQLDDMIRHYPFVDFENNHLISVIRVFREVKAFTAVIVQLLLKFLAIPLSKTRSRSRWTTVSRYISKSKVVPEEKADTNINELQHLDAVLFRYRTSNKLEFIQIVRKRLEEFEATVDGINSHMESITRHLITTRTSLLNFISFY